MSLQDQRRYRLCEFVQCSLTDDDADELLLTYVQVYESSYRLLPGVMDFLDAVIDIPKIIVTNGHRDQQVLKMQRSGLSKYIEHMITPEDCGYRKPDIEPARTLGMKFFHVDQNDRAKSILNALNA